MTKDKAFKNTVMALGNLYLQGNSQIYNLNDFLTDRIVETLLSLGAYKDSKALRKKVEIFITDQFLMDG